MSSTINNNKPNGCAMSVTFVVIVFLLYLVFTKNDVKTRTSPSDNPSPQSNASYNKTDSSNNALKPRAGENEQKNGPSKSSSSINFFPTKNLKSNYNGDALKYVFSNAPYNYEFKRKETTVKESTDTWVQGEQAKNEYPRDLLDLSNEIVVHYDLDSRKANTVYLYLNHVPANLKLNDLNKLFEITDYFDPSIKRYMKKHFRDIFYNENAFDSLSYYKNKDKNVGIGIDHTLFDVRKIIKREGLKNITGNGIVDVKIDLL